MPNGRSGFERSVMTNLVNRGVAFEYETLRLPYVIEHIYNPDLKLNASGIVVECKGLWEADDRRKILAVRKQHPNMDLRMLFMAADNKISKGSSTTYGDFCDKHGIKWAETRVPEEWVNG